MFRSRGAEAVDVDEARWAQQCGQLGKCGEGLVAPLRRLVLGIDRVRAHVHLAARQVRRQQRLHGLAHRVLPEI